MADQQPQQMTLEEFGQSIKRRYPQYGSMSDTDIANKVIAKYPQYKDHIKASKAGQAPPGSPTSTVSARPAFFSEAGLKETGYRAAHAVLDLLPTAGGIAGGMAGGAGGLETGPGAIATAAAGATAGGVLGEDARLELQKHIFPASKGWEPGPTTAKETAKDLVKEGAIQGVNEATGRVAGNILRPAAKFFQDTHLASQAAGVKLLPSEARGGAESYLEKFLKGSVLTAGKMERFRVMQNAQTRAAAEKVANDLSSFTGTPEQLGNLVQQGIEQHTAQFRMTQNQMYGDIDKAVEEKVVHTPVQKTTGAGFYQQTKTVMKKTLEGPAMPSMSALKEFAKKELKLLDQQEKVLDPSLLSSSRSMLQNIVDAPDKVTFRAMAASRSDMLALTRKLDEALPGKQAGFAKKMAQLADQSMMEAADNSGIPGLSHAIRNANALTAETHRIYEQQLIKKVVESKKPEVISRFVAGNGVGVQETRDLMGILPANIRPAVQKQVVLDSMRQSINRKTGMFDERKFADLVTKMGDERGEVVFGKNWNTIKDTAHLMGKINGPTGMTGGSGAALQNFSVLKNLMLTVAAPLGLASGHHPVAAATSLAAEWASLNTLASAMINPEQAAKVLNGVRRLAKAAPFAVTGGYEVAKGQTKATRDLKAIRDKHAAEMHHAQ